MSDPKSDLAALCEIIESSVPFSPFSGAPDIVRSVAAAHDESLTQRSWSNNPSVFLRTFAEALDRYVAWKETHRE